MSEMTLVRLSNVSKAFEKDEPSALHALNTTIPEGQIIGLVGPDGAGKTTLLRLIAGLLKPTTGTIAVCDFDTIQEAALVHQVVGYMPQRFGLYEDLTVAQNLNLYADLGGLPDEEQVERFHELLNFTGLGPFTTRLARALSGGMKQKLGLACALIRRPKLLLLDEPSVGVDPISRRELWKMVEGLLKEDISVIWSTAYLDEAERCGTVLLFNRGKLLYEGPPGLLTQRVAGRVFTIGCGLDKPREILAPLIRQEAVIDATIQGSYVRLLVKKEVAEGMSLPEGLTLTTPRFEDAFIDILGGASKGESPLAVGWPKAQPGTRMVIEARGLTKRYGAFTAADQINLSIRSGEIFGLIGPNGAGKTTIFKMLCGLLRPSGGSATIAGYSLLKASAKARGQIGYMAQKFSLYDTLSVQQNLTFFSGIYNLSGKRQRDAIEQMIEVFDLKAYRRHSASLLPLGFKQRLALACALMHRPQVLFLDEPTSGVDPVTRREFWNHINSLVETGITVMITTHFLEEAEYCHRIALIYQSKIIAQDTPRALTSSAKAAHLEDAFIHWIEQHHANT